MKNVIVATNTKQQNLMNSITNNRRKVDECDVMMIYHIDTKSGLDDDTSSLGFNSSSSISSSSDKSSIDEEGHEVFQSRNITSARTKEIRQGGVSKVANRSTPRVRRRDKLYSSSTRKSSSLRRHDVVVIGNDLLSKSCSDLLYENHAVGAAGSTLKRAYASTDDVRDYGTRRAVSPRPTTTSTSTTRRRRALSGHHDRLSNSDHQKRGPKYERVSHERDSGGRAMLAMKARGASARSLLSRNKFDNEEDARTNTRKPNPVRQFSSRTILSHSTRRKNQRSMSTADGIVSPAGYPTSIRGGGRRMRRHHHVSANSVLLKESQKWDIGSSGLTGSSHFSRGRANESWPDFHEGGRTPTSTIATKVVPEAEPNRGVHLVTLTLQKKLEDLKAEVKARQAKGLDLQNEIDALRRKVADKKQRPSGSNKHSYSHHDGKNENNVPQSCGADNTDHKKKTGFTTFGNNNNNNNNLCSSNDRDDSRDIMTILQQVENKTTTLHDSIISLDEIFSPTMMKSIGCDKMI